MKQIISFKKEVAFKTMIGEITSISLEHTLSFSNDSSIEGDLIINGTYKMTEASTIEETFNYAIPVDIMLTSELEEKDRMVAIDNFIYRIVNEEILEIEVDIMVKGLEKVEIEEVIEKEPEQVEVLEIEEDTSKEKEEDVLIYDEPEILLEEEVRNDEVILSKDSEREEKLDGEEEIATSQAIIAAIPSVKDKQVTSEKMVDISLEQPQQEVVTLQTEQEEIPVMDSIFSAFANTKETYTTYSIYILRPDDSIEDVLTKYQITREELGLYNNLDNLTVGSKLIIPSVHNA